MKKLKINKSCLKIKVFLKMKELLIKILIKEIFKT